MTVRSATRLVRSLALGLALALSLPFAVGAVAAPYVVDFTDYQGGSIEDWLATKGITIEHDAKSRHKVAFNAGADGLRIDALSRARGFIINDSLGADYSSVEIEWGVVRYPDGASYEKKVNNEAIMVHVFLGAKRIASGSMFAPDVPYFLGLFLCRNDRIGHAYTGNYYTKSGRYICLDSPPKGETVVSRYDLQSGPREIFGQAVGSEVSGFSVSVDTTSSGNGKASAIIRRLRFIP